MNAILEQINSAGLRFVEFALPMFVQSGVLILILLLTDFALRKKVRAVFRYWIWMLVLVKLILPTSLSAPLSLGYFFGDQLAYVDGTETTIEPVETAPVIVTPMINPPSIETGSDISAIAPTTPTIEPAVAKPTNPPVVPVTPLSWQGAVFLLWVSVVPAMGLLLLQRAIFVRRLVTRAKEANDSMADTLESCRERMGLKRKIGLKVSASASSPAVCGLFRPVILLPQNLALTLNPSQLRAVLLHELAHIRRGDLWVNLAQTILEIIYFYNPLLWLANSMIRRVREQAVDEMVLVAMGEKAQQYPQTLVDVAKLAFKRPALSLRLIGVVESKSALAGRIKHILNRPMPKKARLGILGLAVVIIIAAILLPMATCRPGPPELVIKGIVTDAQTGKPIAGARVFDDGYGPKPNWEQVKTDERSEWGAITNSAGEYSFLTWAEHHSIKVEAPGYKSERQSLYDGHFVFKKKDEEIFNFTLEPEKASDSSEFKTKLLNGVTVELVGVCEHPSQGKQWWQPDGSVLENSQYPYQKLGKTVRTGIKKDKILELALRFSSLLDKKIGITCDAVDSGFGSYEKDIWATTIQVPRERDKLDIKFGIAAGLWTTIERSTGNGVQASSGSGGAFTFAKAYESNSSVCIIVTHNKDSRKLNYRIVAVDNDSVTHTSSSSTSSGISTWTQTTVHFTNLTLEQIKEFRFQTRPYQWVEFKNVSLKPNFKTDVQVDVEPEKPAGRVQGEGGAGKQLSSGGGYQNLSREQQERLERLRANRQSLSYKNMQKLGLAVAVFANDHKGRCPSNLSDLRKYIADKQIFDWINQNVVYLGKNREYRAPPDAVLAYDESMLKKPPQETNVLYNDAHVSFEKSEWLKEQGIIVEQKPAGVGLNEKSINSDNKVKVGGIVQVENKTEQSSPVGKKVTDIDLPFTFTIYTLTPGGQPQPGVKIRCVHPRPERAEPIVDMIEESNENGVAKFTITKADLLTDWIYWFSLADENYVGSPEVGITPDEENWTFKVLPAEEFELQVISDKRPVSDAKIYMHVDYNKGEDWDPKRFRAYANTRSDSSGRTRVRFVKDIVDIGIAANGYASRTIRGVRLSSDKPYLIELNSGREIKGRVVDANKNPLEGVSITARKEELFHYDEEFILKASTDKKGKFTLKNATPGQWEISARSEDPAKPYFIAPVTMKVRRWWPVRTIKMIAREGFRLKGKYVTNYKINTKDDGGLPEIWAAAYKPSSARMEFRTREDGTFDIWGFPCEGEGQIRFVGMGGYHNFIKMPEEYSFFKIFGGMMRFENVPPGTYENIEVHYLLAGKVSGTVVDVDGKPWLGLEVIANPRGADKTDEEGKYSIWVPPGDNVWLKVQYPKRGPVFTSDMFSVKEGQVIEKNFVIKQKPRD